MTKAPVAEEANCLTSQHTKHSLKHQQSTNAESKLPLPRERFSPVAETSIERLIAGEGTRRSNRAI